jgi:hypothetical protein
MYIVIEVFDKLFFSIVTDLGGRPLIFKEEQDAKNKVKYCQNGIVIKI